MNKKENIQSKKDKILIFDIGGVVLFFDHMLICERLSRLSGYSTSEIYKLIFIGGLEKLYDEGKISSKEFYKRIIRALKVNIPLYEFYEIWSDIFEENTEVSQLISWLKKKKYKIYLLSNTNELHYRYVKNKFSIIKEFDEYFLSYNIGYRKPDLKIFQKVLEKSKLPVNNYIYINDKEEYVSVAKSIGMIGIIFKSSNQLKKELSENGILFKLEV